ncbi:ATP-binding domain-containing protein [Pendulispora rubella]|uniref:ATP-binding domain-containing protein n=1 Tax=Pendulispora rubella TaxID=2741070 RepID=A0ABZ2KWI8_9BACT
MPNVQPRPLTAAESKLVRDHEAFAASVRASVLEKAPSRSGGTEDRFAYARLRDEYAEAGEEDRMALLAQMHETAARADARRAQEEELLPDLQAPYFAHMRLRTAGNVRDVLLGARPYVDTGRAVTIVDFRRAPIAEAFFTCEPGDDYEIEVDRRTVEGVLEARHLVAFEKGAPAAITVEGGALRRVRGEWHFEPGALVPDFSRVEGLPLAAEIDHAQREKGIAALLDADQRAVLERDPKETLLVLGAAGSGKTTVAIHRIAAIAERTPDFDPTAVLVLVPEVGLRHLARRMLTDLGLERVHVRTFDEWIRGEARRVFPWIPEESPDAPAAVRRLKRHPGIFAAIDALVEDIVRGIGSRIDRLHAGRGAIREAIDAHREPVIEHRLRQAEKAVLGAASPAKQPLLKDAFREARRRLERVQADLHRLVGDRALLEHAVRAAKGQLAMPVLEQAVEHTRRQLDDPSAVRFAHVDAERLQTLDGLSLDEDTPDAVAGTIDAEDYAILFELLFRKTGRSGTRAGALRRYRHLVLDEAQGLSPIELRVLGRALAPGGSATVAGDAAQRLGEGEAFASWDTLVSELGVHSTATHLETSYRCPRPILELAYAVLGDEAAGPMPAAAREGPAVLRTVLPGEGHAAVFISEALRSLARREPHAGVAVIAADAKSARAVHEVLARSLPARLVLDGDFAFAPGVEVTEVAQVKGLEFDYVILPDADARTYPSDGEHRRKMHVALTRAVHQVWIVAPGALSPIFPMALAVPEALSWPMGRRT